MYVEQLIGIRCLQIVTSRAGPTEVAGCTYPCPLSQHIDRSDAEVHHRASLQVIII